MKSVNLVLLLFGISISGFCQSSELDEIISELNDKIVTVDAEKKTYNQSIKNSGKGVVSYLKEELTSKGDNTKHTYELNLADIDENTIREETKGDIILVVFTIAGKQKLVKTYKDGELKSYENEVKIVANDIDNARTLKDLFKKSIPIAKQVMEARLEKKDYNGWLEWIKSTITDVDLNGKTYRQEIEIRDYPGGITFSKSIISSKSSKLEKYTFNLADINTDQVRFKVSGDEFGLQIETLREQKVISVEKDNEVRPFRPNFTIVTADVEQARDLRAALLAVVPQAKEQFEQSLPKLTSAEDALKSMAKHVIDVDYGDDIFRQKMAPSCITQFTQSKKTSKGEDEIIYEFNLIDIDLEQLDYSVFGKKMFLEVKVRDNTRLIEEKENESVKGYASKFRIYLPEVEVGRRLLASMKKACELCQESFQNRHPEDADQVLGWITESVANVTIDEKKYEQTVKLLEEEKPKLKFDQREYDDKKSVERVYEFGLSDLDPSSVEYKISGRKISLVVGSKFKEKVIKFYKDNEVQNYVSSFEIMMPSIEDARHMKSALIKVIEKESN